MLPCPRSFFWPLLLLCASRASPRRRRPACSRAARSRRARRFAAAPCPTLRCQTPAAPPHVGQLPAETCGHKSGGGSPALTACGTPNVNLNECQPWQAVTPTMAIGGINGALDFGPLASGVGGEGTGKVRCYRACSRARAHTECDILKGFSLRACLHHLMACCGPTMLLTALPLHFAGAGRQRAVAAGRPPHCPACDWPPVRGVAGVPG